MKTKLFLSTCLFVLSTFAINGQTMFELSIGAGQTEDPCEILATDDGGYIICGYTTSFGNNFFKPYIVKLDANGDTLWTKVYFGGNTEWPTSIDKTSDNGFIVAGICINDNFSDYDIRLMKLDADGDLQWLSTIGTAEWDERAHDVKETSDGGFIMAGEQNEFGSTVINMYLVKTDSEGFTEWTKTYGGSSNETAYGVDQADDGGYILAGNGHSTFSTYNGVMIKTDSDGDVVWSIGCGGDGDDGFNSVISTNDGGFIAAGYSSSYVPGISYDAYLVKTDAVGAIEWTKTYGGIGYDWAYDIKQTSDNGYIFTGYYFSLANGADVYLVKTEANGDTLWTRTFGAFANEIAYSVAIAEDGYITAGHSETLTVGGGDYYIIKTDNEGHNPCHETNFPTDVMAHDMGFLQFTDTLETSGINLSFNGLNEGGGGIISNFCTGEAVEELSQIRIALHIYPNPSAGEFILSMDAPQGGKGEVLLTDQLGKTVMTRSISVQPGINSFALNEDDGIAGGVYSLQLRIGHSISTTRVVIQ